MRESGNGSATSPRTKKATTTTTNPSPADDFFARAGAFVNMISCDNGTGEMDYTKENHDMCNITKAEEHEHGKMNQGKVTEWDNKKATGEHQQTNAQEQTWGPREQ